MSALIKRSLVIVLFFSATPLVSAPPYHPYRNQGSVAKQSSGNSLNEAFSDLRNEVDNHEAEIRMFEERLNTQENIMDSIRQQFLDANVAQKEFVKGSSATLESRMSGLEARLGGAAEDMRKLQSHANESALALQQYKSKIADLEAHIEQLQKAINTLVDALQIEGVKSDSLTVYEVKSGDSLEKIAKRHKTSVSKLKEANQLKNDRIFIGQTLKIP